MICQLLITHQNIKASCFQQGDLVSNGQGGKAWQAFGKFHYLDDAFSGEFTELIPQTEIQLYPLISTGILQENKTVIAASTTITFPRLYHAIVFRTTFHYNSGIAEIFLPSM